MAFFSFKLRPVFRTLAVIAACFWLALVTAYLADRLTTAAAPVPAVPAGAAVAEVARPAPTAAEAARDREIHLYGYDSPFRYRVGSILEFGDMSMLCGFRSNFIDDFRKEFGERINTQELPAPTSELVVTAILRPLVLRLRESRQDEAVLRPVVEYLGMKMLPEQGDSWRFWKPIYKYWQDAQGFWTLDLASDYKESEQLRANRADREPDEAAYRDALRRLPKAYALYFDSLTAERPRAITLMDELLSLPASDRHVLNAIAKYRRARLKMSLDDWAALSDVAAKERLRAIREDLASVAEHAREGSLDPAQISENTTYWIAYTRSMILPSARLSRLGEADFKGAFATYLRMPIRGQANAVNSSFHLVRKLCGDQDFTGCATDPDLRRAITFYLAAGGSNNTNLHLNQAEAKSLNAVWLDALAEAGVDPRFAPAHLAMLQYVAHRWPDCLRTLELLPPDDSLRRLLTSRCNLRLTGDLRASGRILAGLPAGPAADGTSARPVLTTEQDDDFITLLDLSDRKELSNRVSAEKAVVALCQGDFAEAFGFFEAAGFFAEANYVGECLLGTDELKALADRRPAPSGEPAKYLDRYARNRLASRLFREDRLEEALEYVDPELLPGARNYVLLRRLAERTDIADRARADAYWRCALQIGKIGENILNSPLGLDWSSYANRETKQNWYVPYQFMPYLRLNRDLGHGKKPLNVLLSPSKEEALRLQAWLAVHIDKPIRSERDARYASFDLALKAARLLPDNDPAGGVILQYAGNLLKYREPKAANPAYRLLVTRFPQTPYGAEALKRRWFSTERPSPPTDIISK
ncbi:MAG: hypothetical protein ACR2KA_09070 [Opitutales bacterium]